jgi:hypothetical protein
MEQNCHVLGLFWPQVTIFKTNEGCLGVVNDYMSQKYAFFFSKKTFFGLKN